MVIHHELYSLPNISPVMAKKKKNEMGAICSIFGKEVHTGFGREMRWKEISERPRSRW